MRPDEVFALRPVQICRKRSFLTMRNGTLQL